MPKMSLNHFKNILECFLGFCVVYNYFCWVLIDQVTRRTSCPPTDTGPVCLQAHRIHQCRFSRLIAKGYRHVTTEQACGHHIGGFHKGLRPSKTPRPFPEVPSA